MMILFRIVLALPRIIVACSIALVMLALAAFGLAYDD